MIGLVAAGLVKAFGMDEGKALEMAKPFLIVGLVVAAVPAFLIAKSFYDGSVVKSYADEANVDVLERKDKATGDADDASAAALEKFKKEIKSTEELIDEAMEKGCPIAEYVDSNGTDDGGSGCLSKHSPAIQSSKAE